MFNTLRDSIRKWFTPTHPLPAGTYHYQAPPEAEHPYRMHLRLEADGSGLLIINAKTVLHLNPTAAEYAFHLVKGTPAEQVAVQVAARYRVGRDQALQDYKELSERILALIHTEDLDPVTYLDFDRLDPYSTELTAPFRLDAALTYRLPDGEAAGAAPKERVTTELTIDEWKTVLAKAWHAGIPQVVFTGGEPTLRPDLPELLAYAEAQGQVTGLLTDGFRLVDPEYFNTLLMSGLDHIMIVLHPEKEESWQAVSAAIAADIFLTVHLTLTQENKDQMDGTLDRLVEMGARTLSLSAADPALAADLQRVRTHTAEHHLSLVWDLPVPYSNMHPVALERSGEDVPDGAGTAWLYVEPDGDVLPAQGINRVLGNLHRDGWADIWSNRSLMLPEIPAEQ